MTRLRWEIGIMGAAMILAFLSALAPPLPASEFEITATSFTVDNQLNLSSVAYFNPTGQPSVPSANTGYGVNAGGLYYNGSAYYIYLPGSGGTNWQAVATGTISGLASPVGSSLTSGDIFVGNGSNEAEPVGMSGDATLTSAGALTITGVPWTVLPSTIAYTTAANTFTSSQTFTAGGGTTYSLGTSSGIDVGAGVYASFFVGSGAGLTNLPAGGSPVGSSLTSGDIWVGNGSGDAEPVGMSGDASLSNAGALAITTLPAISGAALTGLTAANISAGTASISITGNAATVTTDANLTGAVTSGGNTTTLNPEQTAAATWTSSQTFSAGALFNANGAGTYSVTTSSGIDVENGGVTASFFNGNMNWVDLQNYPAACGAGEFISAVGDTITCGTPAGTGVTSVTASAPIASSGGATPNLSLTGTVAVANGGTGETTAATALTNLGAPNDAGSGASGTWPISISGTAPGATLTGEVRSGVLPSTVAYTNIWNNFTSSQTFSASGVGTYSLGTSSGIDVGAGVYASFFVGSGAGLTNLPAGGSPVGSSLTSGDIWVGNGSGDAEPVAMSGDATLSDAGVLAITTLPAISGAALTGLTAGNISAGTASISITGNAATVTTDANLKGAVTSGGNTTTLNPEQTAVATWTSSQTFSAGALFNANGAGTYSVTTSSGIDVENGGVTASFFNGNMNWVDLQNYPAACGAGEFISAVGDTITCGTPAGTGVTSVTASAPIASSGGATPNLSLTGTVAVANGGTGETTAATALTNLGAPNDTGSGASGTWPISISGTAAGAPPTGTAGGGLAGTYPSPTLATTQTPAITWSGKQTFSDGWLSLNNGTSNTISYGEVGDVAPGAGSAGEKIQLWGAPGTIGAGDYALGIQSSNMWFNTGGGYMWYLSGAASPEMVLTSGGNVGIGTASPSTALQVVGTVTATTFSGSGADLTNLPSGSPSGAAGGGLAGTYPSPTLATTQSPAITWSATQSFNATGNTTYSLTTSSGIDAGGTVTAPLLKTTGGAQLGVGDWPIVTLTGNPLQEFVNFQNSSDGNAEVFRMGSSNDLDTFLLESENGWPINMPGTGGVGIGYGYPWPTSLPAMLSVSGTGYFSGNVGIGTTSPGELLDVAGNATIAGTTFFGTGGSYSVNGTGEATLAANVCAVTGEGLVPCAGNDNGSIGTASVAWANAYAYDFHGELIAGAPDLAERYPGDVGPGDVVVFARHPSDSQTLFDQSSPGPHGTAGGRRVPGAVEKADQPYEEDLAGVVSTDPGIKLEDPDDDKNPPIALTGRVPVKVDLEGGPIHIGDYLTSSSKPGYAMKAAGPGPTVGIALENFGAGTAGTEGTEGNGETGKILCFVHVGGNQAADEKDIKELQSQNASLRRDVEDLKSLVCQDHPQAPVCR